MATTKAVTSNTDNLYDVMSACFFITYRAHTLARQSQVRGDIVQKQVPSPVVKTESGSNYMANASR